jgi:hypothetical protein
MPPINQFDAAFTSVATWKKKIFQGKKTPFHFDQKKKKKKAGNIKKKNL